MKVTQFAYKVNFVTAQEEVKHLNIWIDRERGVRILVVHESQYTISTHQYYFTKLYKTDLEYLK